MWIETELFEEWSIGIGKMILEKDALKLTDYKSVRNPVLTAKHIRDKKVRYVADPFLVRENGLYHMFFEVLRNEKGIIGLAVSRDCRRWKFKKIVLEEPFHLSYPFIFNSGGKYYMLPESQETNSVRLYEAVNFPTEWRFVKTLLEGKDFVDPTIFYFKNKFWMFVSDTSNSVLYLYYNDTLEGEWGEHPKSPIIKNNLTTARPGGNVIFTDNKLIRIAQDDFKDYGYAVRAFEITRLDTQEYAEKELKESPLLKASGIGWNKLGMHHLSVCQNGEKEWFASVDGKTMSKRYKFKIMKVYIKDFVFKQKCIPWRIIDFWKRGGIKEWSDRLQRKIKSFLRKFIIRIFWLKFLHNRAFSRKNSLRIGFLSDEFEHLDLMPFGGHGMTLKFVTDYLNNNGGLLKADVLMCERKDIPEVTVKRYHSADLIFLPQRQGPYVYFKCSRLFKQKGINVFIGVEHFVSYEYYLRNFPYIPWVVWIKAPKDRKIFEKILTVSLEAKRWGANVDGLVKDGERDAESLRRMMKISRTYGRKIYFGAESNHLAEIARRKYGLKDINAFHWPKPIPLPAIEKASFSEKPSFLLLGRLDPIKRPYIFFEMAKRFKDADFYVAGTSHYPKVMDPVIAKYQDIPNLKFLGRIEGNDKAALLDRVWAVVNTSIHEGVPMSLLEGFSYGKPAIAALNPDELTSRFGIYVGEVFGNGDDADSLDRFAAAIARIINGKFDKEGIGWQARQYIAENHSFARFESTLLRVLSTPSNFEYRVY